MSRRNKRRNRINFKPKQFEKGAVLNWAKGTYMRSDLIDESLNAYYTYQRIGRIQAISPTTVRATVNTGVVLKPFFGEDLLPGTGAVSEEIFYLDANYNLIVDRDDAERFGIDYDTAQLTFDRG